LMRVVNNGNYDMAEYLLKVGAHVDAINKRNETALYMACYKGHLELVKLLIKYGANVNSFDCDGDTPLAIACYEKKSDIIKYLLENGANVREGFLLYIRDYFNFEKPKHLCLNIFFYRQKLMEFEAIHHCT
jgi:ankyrin repeat protein